MTRRSFLLLTVPLTPLLAQGRDRARGRLVQDANHPPALLSPDGTSILLDGDAPSLAVLRDSRLKNEDFEVIGRSVSANRFTVDPIHERALFVYRRGQRMVITYWCDICSIRTYTPGECVCCQEETQLDPRDPALKDADPSTG